MSVTDVKRLVRFGTSRDGHLNVHVRPYDALSPDAERTNSTQLLLEAVAHDRLVSVYFTVEEVERLVRYLVERFGVNIEGLNLYRRYESFCVEPRQTDHPAGVQPTDVSEFKWPYKPPTW